MSERMYKPRLFLTLKPGVDPADVMASLSQVNHVRVVHLSDRKGKPGFVLTLQFVSDIRVGTVESLLPYFRLITGVESVEEDVQDGDKDSTPAELPPLSPELTRRLDAELEAALARPPGRGEN